MNVTNLDSNTKCLKLSKEELSVISSSLIEFNQEMHWALKKSLNEDVFKEGFSKKYNFFWRDLEYIEDALSELDFNLRNINITEITIYFSKKMLKKPKIIYVALNECSKNYEDYEISIRTGIARQELDIVLKEFKEKIIDKMEKL